MKVTFEENYKNLYSVNEVEAAKIVIKYERENDSESAKDWAEYAVKEALKDRDDHLDRVLEATAETCRRCGWENNYGEGSGCMDVWIKAIARTFRGYIEVGAYLSDIWNTGAVDYRSRMYVDYTRRQDR